MSGRRVALLLALVGLGTALETLAMPPGPAPALVFVQDAPFLVLLFAAGGTWKRWAFLYGVTRFAVGLRWLAEVHVSMVAGAAVVLAAAQVLWGGVVRALARRRAPFVPLVAVSAVGLEMLQTVVQGASGMPWPARSLPCASFPTLLGAASWAGAYGLSALAAATSAWVSGLPSLFRRDGGARARVQALVAAGLLLGLAHAVAWGGGASVRARVKARLEGPTAVAARTDPLVLVQAAIEQDLKNSRDDPQQILDRHLALTTEAFAALADEKRRALAVLWPETMVPWPFVDRRLAVRFPDAWASQRNVLAWVKGTVPPGQPARFLLGVNYFFEGPRGPQRDLWDHETTDAVVYVDLAGLPDDPPAAADAPAEGGPEGGRWPWEMDPPRHEKVVLVPWGEYTPGGSVLPFLRDLRNQLSVIAEITPGDPATKPFRLGTVPPERPGGANRPVLAGTIVCFELAFPARCRAWRRAGATVLLNAANYGWFGDTGMPDQVVALARLRAVELGATVVVAGNTGPTCIVDPKGDVRTRVTRGGKTQFVEGWCAGPLYVDPGYETGYLRWGDLPWAVAAGGLLAVTFVRRRRVRDGGGLASLEVAPGPSQAGAPDAPSATAPGTEG